MTRSYAPKPPSKALRAVFATLFFVLLVPGLAFGIAVDVFFAGGGVDRPLARIMLVCFVLGATLPALFVVALDRRRWMKLTYGVAASTALLASFVPWHPRMLFVWRLNSVHSGMTVDEVESIMGGYMKGQGKKWAIPAGPGPRVHLPEDPPSEEERADVRRRIEDAQAAYVEPAYPDADERAHATGTMTYRWCDDDWQYDSDFGCVTFKDGRVVSVEFMPD